MPGSKVSYFLCLQIQLIQKASTPVFVTETSGWNIQRLQLQNFQTTMITTTIMEAPLKQQLQTLVQGSKSPCPIILWFRLQLDLQLSYIVKWKISGIFK